MRPVCLVAALAIPGITTQADIRRTRYSLKRYSPKAAKATAGGLAAQRLCQGVREMAKPFLPAQAEGSMPEA
jgi:hypothetical protein